jgi:hypothetical protein
VSALEDTAVQITIRGTDPDTALLTYAIATQPARGALSLPALLTGSNGVVLTYTPGANLNGADSFTFTVTDGTSTSAPATVSINVVAVNDAPVATAQTLNAVAGQAVSITLAGTDVDSSPLTFAVVTNPANGTLSGTVPNLSYTASASFVGVDSFQFRANDGALNSANATVTINVSAPPVVTPPSTGGGGGGGGATDPLTLILLVLLLVQSGARWRRSLRLGARSHQRR